MLRAIKSQGKQVEKQIALADAQRVEMVEQSDHMRKQWRMMHEQDITLREQLGEMVRLTKETRTLAEATKITASAAERNAQVAIDNLTAYREAERVWLSDGIRFPDHIPRQREGHPFGGIVMMGFGIKNIGKHPTFIRIIRSRFHATDTPKLPAQPEYRQNMTTIFSNRLLAPDELLTWECPFEDGDLVDDQIDRIDGLRGTPFYLWAYGRVDYETVGIKAYTQFCYRWHNLRGVSYEGDKPGFRKDGPDAYNEQT